MAWARVVMEMLSRLPMRARYLRKRLAFLVRWVPAQIMARPPPKKPITGDITARAERKPPLMATAGNPVSAMPKITVNTIPHTVRPLPRSRFTGLPCRGLRPTCCRPTGGVCRWAPGIPCVPGTGPPSRWIS